MSGHLISEKVFSNVLSYPLPVSVDAQEKEDSVKNPDSVERLARKYMVSFKIATFSTCLLKDNSENVCWFALGLMVQLPRLEMIA